MNIILYFQVRSARRRYILHTESLTDLLHSWKMVSGLPSTSDLVWISSQMQLVSVPAPERAEKRQTKGFQIRKTAVYRLENNSERRRRGIGARHGNGWLRGPSAEQRFNGCTLYKTFFFFLFRGGVSIDVDGFVLFMGSAEEYD